MWRQIVVLSVCVAAGCALGPDIRALAKQCDEKYRVESPPGTVPAKPVPELRLGQGMRDYGASYACVAVLVNERGEVTEAKLLETDTPGFGAYFLNLVARSRYAPGTLNGKAVATRAVISASVN
jgi:hypothetical protein